MSAVTAQDGDTSVAPNTLTREERRDGWTLLFDGKTAEGWQSTSQSTFPEQGWSIENGELIVHESGDDESARGGDIITIDEYSDFDFKVDFKLTPGANSGIKYFVTRQQDGAVVGLEYQLLDDERHEDATRGKAGTRMLASLYDLIPAENRPINPPGEWNTARIVSKGRRVEHWLNGVRVLEYERGSESFRELVAESKYAKWDGFGEADQGPILLQDHGNRVAFRNIKIRVLR